MRELTVVGQQEEPFGVGVEAADGEHAGLERYQLDDRRAALRVGGGRHDAPRLVEQVVHETRHGPTTGTPSTSTLVGLGIDPPTEHRDVAVDGDAPGGDEFFACTPAAEAGPSQHLLQPLGHGAV